MPSGMLRSQNKWTNIYHRQNAFGPQLQENPEWNSKLVPVDGGEGRTTTTKKMAGHSILASGRFNKKGNSHTRFVMSGPKASGSPHTHRTFKSLHRGLNWVSHIFSPDGLNKTLPPQGYILETAPRVKIVSRTYIPRTGSLWLPESYLRVNGQSCPPNDLLHQGFCNMIVLSFSGKS